MNAEQQDMIDMIYVLDAADKKMFFGLYNLQSETS